MKLGEAVNVRDFHEMLKAMTDSAQENGIIEPDSEEEGARKDDAGKARWDLLPYFALEEVVQVLTKGCTKYGDRNWEKGFVYSRPFAAAMRHLTAFWSAKMWPVGDDFDPETGNHHLAHAICCLLFLLTYEGWPESKRETLDDRPEVDLDE